MRSRSSCAFCAATATVVRAPSGVTGFISACPQLCRPRHLRLGKQVLAGNLTAIRPIQVHQHHPILGSIQQPLAGTDLGDAGLGNRANQGEDLGLQQQLLRAGTVARSATLPSRRAWLAGCGARPRGGRRAAPRTARAAGSGLRAAAWCSSLRRRVRNGCTNSTPCWTLAKRHVDIEPKRPPPARRWAASWLPSQALRSSS